MLRLFPAVLAGSALVLLSGCEIVHDERSTGRVEHKRSGIALGKAEVVNAEFRFGAGELRIGGGASQLMDADFATDVPKWQPDVRYNESGFRGRLYVHQPTVAKIGGRTENTWDVKLNNNTPLDLSIHIGAGESKLDLGSLSMRRLEVHMGAGRIDLNLDGDYKKNFEVEVRGGVGEATVRLPRKVGVVATAKGGIGDIRVQGMRRDGDRWVNDAYQKAKVTISVDVRGGVGQINLIGG